MNAETNRTTNESTPMTMHAICQLPLDAKKDTRLVATREPGNIALMMMPTASPRLFTNQFEGMPESITMPPRAFPKPMMKYAT